MSLRTKSLKAGHIYIHITCVVPLNAVSYSLMWVLFNQQGCQNLLIADSQFTFDQSPTDTSIKLTANLNPTALISSDWIISPCYVQPTVNTSTFCKPLFSPCCLIISPAFFFHEKCIHISGNFHAYCSCHLSPPSRLLAVTFSVAYLCPHDMSKCSSLWIFMLSFHTNYNLQVIRMKNCYI